MSINIPNGNFPIRDENDLKCSIMLVKAKRFNTKEAKNHIIRRALDLGLESELPEDWVEDKWWEEALERQVSLKTHVDCKFCRLVSNNSGPENQVRPWMGTLCNICFRSRMIHRPQHPHIYDAGNMIKITDSTNTFVDCPGFEEPDLLVYEESLDKILEMTNE